MTSRDRTRLMQALNDKAKELADRLKARDGISVEAVPEEAELVQLAAIRELEIETLNRDSELLRAIQAAHARLEDGSFGLCLRCDREIERKRLGAVPWAAYCIDCQEAADRDRDACSGNRAFDIDLHVR
jgi:DnaK suppressor protein